MMRVAVWLWLCVKCGAVLWSLHDARRHEHAWVIKWRVDDAYLTD